MYVYWHIRANVSKKKNKDFLKKGQYTLKRINVVFVCLAYTVLPEIVMHERFILTSYSVKEVFKGLVESMASVISKPSSSLIVKNKDII